MWSWLAVLQGRERETDSSCHITALPSPDAGVDTQASAEGSSDLSGCKETARRAWSGTQATAGDVHQMECRSALGALSVSMQRGKCIVTVEHGSGCHVFCDFFGCAHAEVGIKSISTPTVGEGMWLWWTFVLVSSETACACLGDVQADCSHSCSGGGPQGQH